MRKKATISILAHESAAPQIRAALSRRQALIGLGGGAAAALVLAACGSAGPTQPQGGSTPEDLGGQELEGQLVLANYADYIDEENVTDFTSAFGPQVKLVTYSTGTEMITKLASGTSDYDIVVPGPSETAQLIERNLLRPLDKALIPNIANVTPEVTNLPFDPDNKFTVPKAVGLVSFWWNREIVTGTADSLAGAFDLIKANPDAKVNFFDGAKETFTVALAAIGKPINSTDPADIEAAKQLLISVKPLIDSFGVDEIEGGSNGSIDLNLGYNTGAHQINTAAGREKVYFMVPEVGSTEYFIDNWAIPASAKNPVAAHKFIDYMSSPEPAGKEMNTIGTLVPIKGIQEFVEPNLYDNPTINLAPNLLARYQTLVATPEYLDLVGKAYNEFRAA